MNRNRKNQLFLLLLSAGIFYACLQNDLFENQVPLNLPPEIAVAKQWYETEIGGNALHWRMGGKSSMLEADWQNAFAGNKSDFRIIEVPLTSDSPFYRMISEVAERAESTGDERYRASATRLLIRTCRETGERDAFVMIASPDLDYLTGNLDNPLRNFTYINRGEFSGLVFFYDLAGELASGFHITGGKAFQFFSEASMANQPQLRAAGMCTFECTRTRHYDVWLIAGVRFERYIGSTHQCVLIKCIAWDETGGGDGGINPPGTDEQQPHVRLDRIFRRGNMIDEQWERLERLFNQMKDNCVGEALINALAERTTGANQLNFHMSPTNRFIYTPQGDRHVIIRPDAGHHVLFHEMFHAFQSFGETPEVWNDRDNNPLLNMEMEARYAEYMFYRQIDGFEGSDLQRDLRRNRYFRPIMDLARYLDYNGNPRTGANMNRFDRHITRTVIPRLRGYEGNADLRHDASRVGIDNFRNMQKLNIDC